MHATARVEGQPAQTQTTTEPESLPIEERIRRRAYELYVERESEDGSEYDDWLRAEEETRSAVEQEQESKYA